MMGWLRCRLGFGGRLEKYSLIVSRNIRGKSESHGARERKSEKYVQ